MLKLVVLVLIGWGLYKISTKILSGYSNVNKDSVEKYSKYLAVGLTLVFNFSIVYFGLKIPGSLFLERSFYSTTVPIEIHKPAGLGIQKGKVTKDIGYVETYEGNTHSFPEYRLEYIELDSGARINFNGDNIIFLERKNRLSDSSSRQWEVEVDPLVPFLHDFF